MQFCIASRECKVPGAGFAAGIKRFTRKQGSTNQCLAQCPVPMRVPLRCPWQGRTGRLRPQAAVADDSKDTAQPRTAGRMTYKPATFKEMVGHAVDSVLAAIADGETRLEVQFPALPLRIDDYKGDSEMYVDANTQLAIAGATMMAQKGKKVHLLVPDKGEYERTLEKYKTPLEMATNVSLGYLNVFDAFKGPAFGMLSRLFTSKEAGTPSGDVDADVFVVINCSAVELLDVERYCKDIVRDRALVLWNLELDTLRSDLGLFGFPKKEMQYRFLCRFIPAFYLRPREYSKTINVSPFIINYDGALFREYPGPYQVMLKTDTKEYACIAEDEERYNLGDVKECLLEAVGLAEEAGSTMEFLRRGYKNSTWWEDAVELEESKAWRR